MVHIIITMVISLSPAVDHIMANASRVAASGQSGSIGRDLERLQVHLLMEVNVIFVGFSVDLIHTKKNSHFYRTCGFIYSRVLVTHRGAIKFKRTLFVTLSCINSRINSSVMSIHRQTDLLTG